MINYYATLGVLPTASLDEIRASYRQLAKRHHPDVRGGSAHSFARIREAYETLSEAASRAEFDKAWLRRRQPGAGQAGTSAAGAQPAQPKEAPREPIVMLTRIMSMAMPAQGRFQLEGIIGRVQIEPTTPENLWDTTLRKFHDLDREYLARHVLQIRLHGEKALVQTILPRPTDYGVELQNVPEEERRKPGFLKSLLRGVGRTLSLGDLFQDRPFGAYGAFLPMSLVMTVPRGLSLVLRNVTGMITVGDVQGELVANLLGGMLRAGQLNRASLTLNGSSRAYLSRVTGPVDAMVFGTSQLRLDGQVTRLRAVVENHGQMEVRCPVPYVQAELGGHGFL
ncbi:MAG TPA: DnaJ domain-containing protein, partial [bacterium]|nr:DnaJ domain-containing protein [bacterium]